MISARVTFLLFLYWIPYCSPWPSILKRSGLSNKRR